MVDMYFQKIKIQNFQKFNVYVQDPGVTKNEWSYDEKSINENAKSNIWRRNHRKRLKDNNKNSEEFYKQPTIRKFIKGKTLW